MVFGLEGSAVYLDDVVVFRDIWEEYLRRVKARFKKLVWANLTISLSKCEFAKARVTYFGTVVKQGSSH